MICIVGADGFFGAYLQKHIQKSFPQEQIIALNHEKGIFDDSENLKNIELKLENEESRKNAANIISTYENIRIIFLACVHNPDIVKQDKKKAEHINFYCYEDFLDRIKKSDVKKLIYSSSDTVYGESKNGYVFSEKDTPIPVNIYGEQKLKAENITTKYGFSVARYSYMAGKSLSARKEHFFDSIAKKLQNGEKVYMLTDFVRNSLSYHDASNITLNYLLSDISPDILNICADSPTSKYDLGIKIADYIKADTSLVIPITKEKLGIFNEYRADEILMSNTLSVKYGFANKTELRFKEIIW